MILFIRDKLENTSVSYVLIFFVILFWGLFFRIWELSDKALWYDELQSVTFAYLPINQLIKSVWTFDPHPYFYYIQLHFWMIFGLSDWWIKLNSGFWYLSTAVLLFISIRYLFNKWVSLLTTFFFVITPFAVFQAQNVRMYSMLMFLGLCAFLFSYIFLKKNNTIWIAFCFFLPTLLFLYSHGASFLIIPSLFLFSVLFLLFNYRKRLRRFLQYNLGLLIVLILYIPWLNKAQTIFVSYTTKPNLFDVMKDLNIIFFGFNSINYPNWIRWIGFVTIVLLIIVALTYNAISREIIISFVICPIGVAIIVSYLNRPIWLFRTIAFITPFVCIALAISVIKLQSIKISKFALGNTLLLIIVAVMFIQLFQQQKNFYFCCNFKDAAEYIRANTKSGDVVYIPHPRVFWGFNWYFNEPGSVNPLETDYSIENTDEIRVLSSPHYQYLVDHKISYWVLVRDFDIPSFFSERFEVKENFNQLYIGVINP